jgi:hypothetical protein
LEFLGEERWNTWMVFECSNIDNHPDDSQVGVAILTNGFYGAQVTNRMSEKVCSICGESFLEAFTETALTLFLQHDIGRFQRLGYNVLKDEEVLWK